MKITLSGFHAIEEALKNVPQSAPADIFKLFYDEKTGPRVKKILALADKRKLVTQKASPAELNRLVEKLPDLLKNHRGLVLVYEQENPELSLEQFLAENLHKKNLTVAILSNIIDPHNVGAILRSAEQFGIDALITGEKRSAGDYATIAKISSGANQFLPLIRVKNLNRASEILKAADFWLYGADLHGDALPEIDFPPRCAIVLGSEGRGISEALKSKMDKMICIPTCGKVDSLNVSNAAAVIFYARFIQTKK